jgi:hypothetical protein
MKKSIYALLFFGITFISSCKKDEPPQQSGNGTTINATGGIYIINEGNFLGNNAKLGYYNKAEHATIIDLFTLSNGAGVGDLLQSMMIYNNNAYLVVNNSGKIEVCNPISMKKKSTIAGFTSPRYILPVSTSKAYVSDLFANKIWKVDLNTNTISGSISLNGWSEQMAEVLGKVYIANYTTGKVYVLDSSTDLITDSITVSAGASSIKMDANGKLWVLCSGDGFASIPPSLDRINPTTNTVEFSMPLTGYPSRLSINGTSDTLYFLNSGVYQLPITATSVSSPLISSGTANFYGLGIDPQTSLIYVSDAVDFVQYGKVYIYKPNGVFVKEFTAGIIPGDFWFQ